MSDASSDGERPNNNNDATFVYRQSDQLSLPLKKRKPPAKTPDPDKPKPSRGKSSFTNSRLSSAPSVAIGGDEITPLPVEDKKVRFASQFVFLPHFQNIKTIHDTTEICFGVFCEFGPKSVIECETSCKVSCMMFIPYVNFQVDVWSLNSMKL